MGTDREEYGSGPCPCGQGSITVDHCSPDHPWAGGYWFEARLQCSTCAEKYAIEDVPGGQPMLVLLSDLEARQAASNAWRDKRKAIEVSQEFVEAAELIRKMVAQQPSAAAKHRLLRGAGLTDASIASFRKRPTYEITGRNVAYAMTALGMPRPKLAAMCAEVDALWPAVNATPPAVVTGIVGLLK